MRGDLESFKNNEENSEQSELINVKINFPKFDR